MTVSIRASLLFSALAMAALTAAFAAPAENATSPAAPHAWSYGGESGPEHWAELGPDNKVCSSGAQQSPIDLASAMPASATPPQVNWLPAKGGMVVNNGHTIEVDVDGAGGVEINGVNYALKQFHFHHPSEHTVNGKSFPLELHLVNQAADGRLAVISVLFLEGTPSPALDMIWATAPAKEAKAAVAFQIDPAKFLPESTGAFRYEGSLTTPPCSENVTWTVMAQPQTVSASQVAAFSTLFPNNARPVQPLNRRYVLKTGS